MASQGASNSGGQGAGSGGFVKFTRPAAQRIAKAVLEVERGSRDQPGLTFDHPVQMPAANLKVATFTGSWDAGSWKTVTLQGSTQTASVYNWTTPVATCNSTESRFVVFGKASGTQSLVEVQLQSTSCTCVMSLGGMDLTQLGGYSASDVQVLGHNTTGPCLVWYSVTTCATSTAA